MKYMLWTNLPNH